MTVQDTEAKYTFHEGNLPPGFRFSAASFLFNTLAHRATQLSEEWISYYVLNGSKRQVLAEVHFAVDGRIASSPARAPFGSFHFSRTLPADSWFSFIVWVEGQLREKGMETIRLKASPYAYQPVHNSMVDVMLINRGFKAVNAEIGACIQVSKEAFVSRIHMWEKRKLSQARKAGLRFRMLDGRDLEGAYHFIASCRTERGKHLSMSWPQLKQAFDASQNRFHIFGAFKNKELTSAAITIRVAHDVLYTFYFAHSRAFDSLSPVVFLMNGIYSWAKRDGIELIDLGTSAQDGVPNFSLLQFKLNLGAKPTHKFTFQKELL